MNLVSFPVDAGADLFSPEETRTAARRAQAEPDDAQLRLAEIGANRRAATRIEVYLRELGLHVDRLRVEFDGWTGTAMVLGHAPDQATRERLVLACGNVRGVAQVDDLLTVDREAAWSRLHTVAPGETLAAIAAAHYGSADARLRLFDANRPVLDAPDDLRAGIVLRVPA